MDIKNANNWSPHSAMDALVWSFSSFVILSFWMHFMGQSFYSIHPYKFYFFVATLLAYFFGYITASIYIVIATIYANFYFVPPFGAFTITTDEFERFLINLLFGSVAIFFIEVLQRARFKSKLLLLVSESRYLILLHRDNQLLQESKRKNNV
jgi:K+-sensing histidine kinase KdpD